MAVQLFGFPKGRSDLHGGGIGAGELLPKILRRERSRGVTVGIVSEDRHRSGVACDDRKWNPDASQKLPSSNFPKNEGFPISN